MRGKASVQRGKPGNSLMARLAAVNGGVLDAPERLPRRPVIYRARRRVSPIGVGLASCGLACGVGLLLLLSLRAEDTGVLRTPPAAREAVAALAPRQDPAAELPQTPTMFEIPFSHAERERAPFPLRIAGPAGEDATVVLRDVPAAAWLSRGERKDEHTWLLRHWDLQDLHLTLNEGTPDAFDMVMDVLGPPGTVTVPTVARVRLVSSLAEQRAGDPLGEPGAAQSGPGGDAGPSIQLPTLSEHRPTSSSAALPRVSETRRSPASPRPADDTNETAARQLWWSLPSWAPLPDLPGGP